VPFFCYAVYYTMYIDLCTGTIVNVLSFDIIVSRQQATNLAPSVGIISIGQYRDISRQPHMATISMTDCAYDIG